MKIYRRMEDLIGNTPLLELSAYAARHGLSARLLAKLESMNPAGSAKDRVAAEMIAQAEADGRLRPGAVIIEPTSGNTGIGLAAIGVSRGYRVIIVMPDSMSVERRMLMRAYGAEVVLTPGAQGMRGAIERAEAIARETPGSFIPGQFENPANPAAHRKTTGPEIWRDTDGRVDVFVAGVGTGGTISGVGAYLRQQNPGVRIVAAEPAASPLLNGGMAASHGIQGIGANFIPENYDAGVVDEVIDVPDDAAVATARELAARDGLLVGISSGCAVWAAARMAERPENAGKWIVALLPDSGERYLSVFAAEEDHE